MLKRLALACGGLLLACGLWQASDASRFEPVTSAQLAVGLPSCAGSGAVGYTLQVTGTNTFGCASSTPGTGALRYDTGQSLTATQQDQVRTNVGGAVPSAPSASATLAVSDLDRPLFPTGTITLTVPNGGAGWRTGPVVNANTVSGLITFAVPSGATLDGISNGTSVLFPYQRARIVQTGATAYVTDWIDRTPIIAAISPSGVAAADVNVPVGYTKFRVEISGISLSTSGAYFSLRFGDAGGVKSGAADYTTNFIQGTSNASTGGQDNGGSGSIARNNESGGTLKANSTLLIYPGASGQYPNAVLTTYRRDPSPSRVMEVLGIDYAGGTSGAMARANLFRWIASSGTYSANITVTGVP